MPLIINYDKLLFEDKKKTILDFARVKLADIKLEDDGDELVESVKYKVLKAIINFCDTNVTCSQSRFLNVGSKSLYPSHLSNRILSSRDRCGV